VGDATGTESLLEVRKLRVPRRVVEVLWFLFGVEVVEVSEELVESMPGREELVLVAPIGSCRTAQWRNPAT